jgi:hypothetical protein
VPAARGGGRPGGGGGDGGDSGRLGVLAEVPGGGGGGGDDGVYLSVNRGPCRVYSLVTDEYTQQIRRLTDAYTWQCHVSPVHDMFVG